MPAWCEREVPFVNMPVLFSLFFLFVCAGVCVIILIIQFSSRKLLLWHTDCAYASEPRFM